MNKHEMMIADRYEKWSHMTVLEKKSDQMDMHDLCIEYLTLRLQGSISLPYENTLELLSITHEYMSDEFIDILKAVK